MPTILIPLSDILTDDSDRIDLSALPDEEVIGRLQSMYGFLGPLLEIEIRQGVAVLTLPDPKDAKVDSAMAKLEQAERAAVGGNYRQAVRLFEEGLKVLPDHTAARRDLAMSLYELGNFEAAKKHLIRVLQLDPDDANTYLVLGNIYLQADQDFGSAERYYAGALDLEPDNAYVLNSYAGLKAKRELYAEAIPMFDRAAELVPDYPNPRYGLALCLMEMGDLDAAIDTLDSLFAAPTSSDLRHAPVY